VVDTTVKPKDNTISTGMLPQAGDSFQIVVGITILGLMVFVVYCKIKLTNITKESR